MNSVLDELQPRLGGSAAAAATSGTPARFMLGDWLVDLPTRRLIRGSESATLEPRFMAVLTELCRRPGQVIGAEALLDACWPGTPLGDNPVHKVIAGLRRTLHDSATAPRYIETIRKQGYRLLAPIRVLSSEGPRSSQGGWRNRSPFRGLEPFGVEHASVFFGRDDAVAALHARLAAQWGRGHPMVVLLGPSGSGKTSLVQAGLLPAMLMSQASDAGARYSPGLQICSAATIDLAALGELDPWSALAGALLDWECGATPLLSGHSIDTLARALPERCDEVLGALRIGLNAARLAQGDGPPHTPPLLVFDRLEAMFQHSAASDSAHFLACIDRLVQSRLMLVLAVCRNDFYPSLARHATLMRDKENGAHMDLAAPDAEAMAQIIRLPARAADLVFGTDDRGMNRLDDRLCADATHAQDALPLLQYTLQALYQERGAGNELTWAAYDALGGLEGAVGRRAEAVLAGLSPPQQDALARLLPRIVGMTTDDSAPTSRWVSAADLSDDNERALVQAFVEARLLVADHVGGSTGFRVAHEALLRRWPRVTAWIAQHRAALATREELRPWVHRWLAGQRAGNLLLPRAALLWQAAGVLADAPDLFGPDERAFVTASRARIRRQVRWRWGALVATVLLAMAALAAAFGYARLARLASEREHQSQRLASFMLGDLADQLRPIGKLDLLHSIGEQGLMLFGHGQAQGESPADVLQRAKALVVIGEVNSSRGKGRTDMAVAALGQAWQRLEPLERAPGLDLADYYKTLGAAAFWLGQIAFDAGDVDAATREMLRYRQACERWQAALPNDPQARTELSFALNSLGSIALKRGAWQDASQWFQSALDLKLSMLAAHPHDAGLLDAVASSRNWLGQTAHVQGKHAGALLLYDAAVATQRQLLSLYPDEHVRLHDLGVLEVRRGEALQALGRMRDAVQATNAAVEWLQRAHGHDASNLHWRVEKLHAESGLVLMQLNAGESNTGIQALRQHLAEASQALATDYLGRETLARAAMAEAELASRSGNPQRTLDLAARLKPQLQDLLRLQPHNWQTRELQARLALLVVRSHVALGQTAERDDACRRTREELQPAIDSGQAGMVLETWLAASQCSGAGRADAASMYRLTSGGYRPATALLDPPRHP